MTDRMREAYSRIYPKNNTLSLEHQVHFSIFQAGWEARDSEKWQAIDTAPKDGWRGLVFMDIQQEGFIESRNYQRIACYDKNHGFLDKHCGRKLDPQPTHWMPLPSAPQPPHKQEG